MTDVHKLRQFFGQEKNFAVLHILLVEKKTITLRELEFCARNFATYAQDPKSNAIYLDTLSVLGKRRFDAFRRASHFMFSTKHGKVKTNYAQLRFVRFTIEAGIFDYAKKNKNKIFIDMTLYLKTKSTKKKGSRAKRKKNTINTMIGWNKKLKH